MEKTWKEEKSIHNFELEGGQLVEFCFTEM